MYALLWDTRLLRRCVKGLIALLIEACASSDPADGQADDAMLAAKQLVDDTAGKACKSDKDCESGSCKQEIPAFPYENRNAQSAPGGFCTLPCHVRADCGEGGVCIGAGESVGSFDLDDGTGLCLASCDADTPCRDGYSCVDLLGQVIGSENALMVSTGSCQPQVDDAE